MPSRPLRPIRDPALVATRQLVLPGGNALAFTLYGDPDGRPMHFFHGFPSSRLLAALVHESAIAAGICLIAADRPGFGKSSPVPDRTMLDWCDTVSRLADHLGQQEIEIIGVSCGGAYALACAATMPDRVRLVGLLAGMGPMDVPAIRKTQAGALKLMFGLSRLDRRLAAPIFALDRMIFRGNQDRALQTVARLLTPPDRMALGSDPELARRFVASMAEAYAQGIDAAIHEAWLIAKPRPYRLADIHVPVHVFQGGVDRHVPAAMGAHIAGSIPGARLHLFPDEGHLSIVTNRFPDCVAALDGAASSIVTK